MCSIFKVMHDLFQTQEYFASMTVQYFFREKPERLFLPRHVFTKCPSCSKYTKVLDNFSKVCQYL